VGQSHAIETRIDEMEELTVEELIKYAVRVQQESFLFYRRAAKILEGNEVKIITDRLADSKALQLKRLKEALIRYTLDANNEDYMIDVDTTFFDAILENGDVPAQANPRDVLLLSFDREDKTVKAYEMILKLPLIEKQILRVFTTLKKMEQDYIGHIQTKIESIPQR